MNSKRAWDTANQLVTLNGTRLRLGQGKHTDEHSVALNQAIGMLRAYADLLERFKVQETFTHDKEWIVYFELADGSHTPITDYMPTRAEALAALGLEGGDDD